MKINLSHFEETQSVRKALFEKLLLPTDVRLDFAFDVVHGLNDLTRSLADLHPHKRSIAVLGAQPPPLAEIAMQFAGQGFSVQTIPVSFLKMDDVALKAAWDTLKKDTLFVLCGAVEPLTGAIYPYDWIRHEAAKKNIFTIIYQSPDSLTHGLIIPETHFESICADPLWGETSGLNLLLKGERCLGDKLFWGEPRYELEAIKKLEEALLKPLSAETEDKVAITAFENKLKMQLGSDTHFLGEDIPRLYDRAVFFVDGVGGESLVHELKKNKIESFTAAACAWDNPNINSWLPHLGLTNQWVQSSLILPLAEIKKPTTFDHLGTAISSLRKISGATV
jgi:cysteine sulfinate desulfinase/cysteine desulfurase-like protein